MSNKSKTGRPKSGAGGSRAVYCKLICILHKKIIANDYRRVNCRKIKLQEGKMQEDEVQEGKDVKCKKIKCKVQCKKVACKVKCSAKWCACKAECSYQAQHASPGAFGPGANFGCLRQ